MDSVAFVVPVLPGQTGADRVVLESCWVGGRREAFQDARRRAGITREAVWIQATPLGDLAVVYLAADHVAGALAQLRASDEPFDRWFQHHVRTVHGVTWDEELLDVELVLDFDIDRA